MVVVQVTKLSRSCCGGGYYEPRDDKCWGEESGAGKEAERVERSSTLKSRTGERQSVVRDKLEVFTSSERSSLRGKLAFGAGEPQIPEYCRSVSVMCKCCFLHSPCKR